VRKIEREGGKPLQDTSIAFNKAGEVLPPKTPAMARSMYTKGSFASSSAPENSHTPQQSKAGGDDEAVSTGLSESPQHDKIVQNSERNAATHVTPPSGAEYSLLDREKEVNGVYDAYLHGFKPTHHDPIVATLVHSA
jgi:hypothetical protein